MKEKDTTWELGGEESLPNDNVADNVDVRDDSSGDAASSVDYDDVILEGEYEQADEFSNHNKRDDRKSNTFSSAENFNLSSLFEQLLNVISKRVPGGRDSVVSATKTASSFFGTKTIVGTGTAVFGVVACAALGAILIKAASNVKVSKAKVDEL